ncbi:MAG: M1 family metallopeptidase [Clostridia bacterium]|nr:M1 family metallopeptidase [Clostridia bacterium]
MDTKIKRRIFAITLACILSAVIAISAFGIGQSLTHKTPLYGLAATAQDFGTIKLDCNYNEESHTLAVNQTTTYINHSTQTLFDVKFHLYGNAFKKNAAYPAVAPAEVDRAYPNGFDEGYAKVTTPHILIGGEDNTVITVPLSHGLKVGDSIDIDLQYTVKLANVKHRLGYTDHAVNLGNFYAIPVVYDNGWQTYPYSYNGDPFYNEPYNFDVTITAPVGYQIATSGTEINTNHYQGYVLRDFAIVMSRDFQTLTREVGDTTVTYYYLNDEIPDISLYTACNALAYFSNTFIDYPYSTLSVVQTDFNQGGMEYGALVYISLDVTDQLQYQNVIVHEIAHQWWYGLVGNNQIRTAWIDEGLAEYCTAVFFETHPQYGKTLDEIAEQNKTSIKMFESIMDEYGVYYTRQMYNSTTQYKMSTEYTINTYARGMLLFYAIHEMVGYENLNAALAQYATDHCYGFATFTSLTHALEDQLGYDLVKFMNNYLAGRQDAVL